jgi:isocitrate dehydrogenase
VWQHFWCNADQRCLRAQLIFPYVDVKTEYYDLGLPHRDETSDQVTIDAAHAIQVRDTMYRICPSFADLARISGHGTAYISRVTSVYC